MEPCLQVDFWYFEGSQFVMSHMRLLVTAMPLEFSSLGWSLTTYIITFSLTVERLHSKMVSCALASMNFSFE